MTHTCVSNGLAYVVVRKIMSSNNVCDNFVITESVILAVDMARSIWNLCQ